MEAQSLNEEVDVLRLVFFGLFLLLYSWPLCSKTKWAKGKENKPKVNTA